jgi:hypothetical protein
MTSAYTEFDNAIRTKSVYLAETTMAGLPRIGHEHRAALILLYNEKAPEKYETAARRWIGRLLEDPRCRLTLADVARVASALEALPAVGSNSRFEVAAILKRADLRDVARVFAPGATPP